MLLVGLALLRLGSENREQKLKNDVQVAGEGGGWGGCVQMDFFWKDGVVFVNGVVACCYPGYVWTCYQGPLKLE